VSRRVITVLCVFLFIASASLPCRAWLFDGGSIGSGFSLNNGTNIIWAAALFVVPSDSYATSFGTALSRMTADTSFDVYLTDSLQNIAGSAIAHWSIAPTGPILQYYYVQPANPIFLTGGKAYALAVMPSNADSYGAVASSNRGYLGYLSSDQGANWYQQIVPFAVRVDGTVVPEPCGFILITTGLAILSRKLKLR